MKKFFWIAALFTAFVSLSSCEKDEGKLPDISFKTGASYLSADATLDKGSSFTIGINAAKTEDKDVLKKFNISKAVGAAAATTVYSADLTGAEGDQYSFDFKGTAEATAGEVAKYTFTVTNRDGLVNQVSLSVTSK